MPVDAETSGEMAERGRGAAATAALADTIFGPVEWVAETASTNADLLLSARNGAGTGLTRVADHQSAGRGRRDRSWTTAPGDALLVSVLLRPSLPADSLGSLTAAFAVAAADACTALGCPGSLIKWPNDLVVGPPGNRRKLAGILAQSEFGHGEPAVVVGLGLNVRSTELSGLAPEAIALDELGVAPDRLALLVEILRRADRLLRLDTHRDDLWPRYRELSGTIGTTVRAQLDHGVIEGVATEVTNTGTLLVEADSTVVEVVAADVVSLRSE